MTVEMHKGRIMGISSKTPPKQEFPNMNREQRRRLIYRGTVGKLLYRIKELRKDMIEAGIKPPHPPRYRNTKYLSGYMSRLVSEVTK